ncbi:S41 family peptidase [Xanthovirga aplysinae]|uniref:S41 family peptidase n=1 Tax=Xanthovirga aplysinae TaxID=2529853 RepID=UPI0012BCDBBA|nr:S41 family peptidase [Xanthovirga aplysinae]MTI31969.1 hypothetical protein [Xanthovirga aplysinae]
MRKKINIIRSLIITSILSPFLTFAQSNNDLVKEIQELMLTHYIFLEKAKETNSHLDQLMKENYFDAYTQPEELAKALTEQLRKITNDKHLGAYPPRQQKEEVDPIVNFQKNLSRYYTPMINGFKYFDNNVGYLDMRFFGGGEENYSKIDQVLQQLTLADALIIDMRKNGGGSPHTVQYLCSYFFDQHFLLNSIYSRNDDHTEELWTMDVQGKKRPKVPIYILSSERTFSGAEDFSYTMQNLKRATIIGEVTGGGAHPTRSFPLANGFEVRIPFARTINPITKTNWEGVGVIPDINIPADKALEKAKELATLAANEYKNAFLKPLENVLNSLEQKEITKETEDRIFKLFNDIVKANMLNENDINILGYNYLLNNKINRALVIFKANTLLFPNSANVYDSYAEALGKNGQKELAIANYKKAIAVATEQNHRFLEAFKQNLKSFQERNN